MEVITLVVLFAAIGFGLRHREKVLKWLNLQGAARMEGFTQSPLSQEVTLRRRIEDAKAKLENKTRELTRQVEDAQDELDYFLKTKEGGD